MTKLDYFDRLKILSKPDPASVNLIEFIRFTQAKSQFVEIKRKNQLLQRWEV